MCTVYRTEAEFMNVQFVEISGHNLESFQTSGFRLQCLHYNPVSNSLVEVTENSKKENS